MQSPSDFSAHTHAAGPALETGAVDTVKLTTQSWQAKQTNKGLTWYQALKEIMPLYIASHVLFLLLTYLSVLFNVGNFSKQALPLSTLVESWNRWDSGHFTAIATRGYDGAWRTAFFPLFPLLERVGVLLIHHPFLSGLIISNVAGLGVLAVLYRLVEEDFDQEHAYRATLFLAVFPTAFFFAAAYNESLFLFLALLSFYSMRRGRWWLAGVFGLLASLTRSAGPLLLLPFLYEYLRQHSFSLKKTRFDILSGILIPAGLALFALYCYVKFHDALAFSHAQKLAWNREFHVPWYGLIGAFVLIVRSGLNGALSFDSIHNVIELSAGLLMLVLVTLCFVGPWKFSGEKRSYALYAAVVYLFSLIFPAAAGAPLAALSRYVLEIFPAFIILAMMVKKQRHSFYWMMFSVSILAFLLVQFLSGYWVI